MMFEGKPLPSCSRKSRKEGPAAKKILVTLQEIESSYKIQVTLSDLKAAKYQLGYAKTIHTFQVRIQNSFIF